MDALLCKDKKMETDITSPGARRSARTKRRRESYSPELKSDSKQKKQNAGSKAKPTNRANPKRLYDIMPNGEPFCCHMCRSPYVASPANKTGKKERSRHVPLPKTRVDKTTGREMVLCNACAQTFDRPCLRVKKPVPLPTEEDLQAYTQEAAAFTKLLRQTYDDPRVERLFCPVSKKKLCGCLQKYIKSKGIDGAESPVPKFLELMKEAETLRKEKAYVVVSEINKSKKFIGLGNGHKKSKRYEEFVLVKRPWLKDTLRLCERAVQRILIYSNNFLHKKLKTENRPCRIQRTRGKAAMGKLPDLHTLVELNCCSDNCVMLALTHRKLLQEWRDRAQLGQTEARRVLGEMLTPAGACHCNCYQFISMVTGCSLTTIGRVCNQMIDTHGDRDPPEHGMKKVWQENYKKNKVSESETTEDLDFESSTSNTDQLQTVPSTRQEVTSEHSSANQIAATSTNYEVQQQKLALIQQEISQKQQQLQQQKLALIQQELSQKQQQLQQQEVNLQLLAQQVSSSPGAEHLQNTAFVQQLFKQLASQNVAAGNSNIEVMQVSQPMPGLKAGLAQQGFHGNKPALVTNQMPTNIIQPPQQIHNVSPTNVQWNQTTQPTLDQSQLNISQNQSVLQLPVPVKPPQLLAANQSPVQSALNQSQFPVSQNPTPLPVPGQVPVMFNQLPQQLAPNQSPLILPMNHLNILVSQTGQVSFTNQMVGQRPSMNVQNVILDPSQIVLEARQSDASIASPVLQPVERQPVDNQSVQIQLVPCQTPTIVENQQVHQQDITEGSQVQLHEIESTPIVLSPDMIQQLIKSGNLQILPQASVARNTEPEMQGTVQTADNQESALEAEATSTLPTMVMQASPMPQLLDQMPVAAGHIMTPIQPTSIVCPPPELRLTAQDEPTSQIPKTVEQTLSSEGLVTQRSMNNIQPASSIIQKVVPKSKKVYRERQHSSSSEHKKKKKSQQSVTITERVVGISNETVETTNTSIATIAHTSESIARTANLDTGDNHEGSKALDSSLRGTQHVTTQFPTRNTGETPSQIQISFETVIDKNGQTATSHILLPHSNVVTLPIIPLYSSSDTQPQDRRNIQTQSTVDTPAQTSAMATKVAQTDFRSKETSRNEKTTAKRRATKKFVDKSIKIGEKEENKDNSTVPFETVNNNNKEGGDAFVRKDSMNIAEVNGRETIGQEAIHTIEIVDYGKPDSAYQLKSRHSSESFDKSRHSSGSSIRSRQSSGNSESLRQVLAFDTLRPLSGMSDILERSRQYSGNSQLTIRSRTSSGNSYLNEQLQASAFQNISPTALFNKEKGVFFVSSDSDLVELNSLHMTDSVHQISDFILNDEHISELHTQTEMDTFVENQSQTHIQAGSPSDFSKNAVVVDNIDNQSHGQTGYRPVLKSSRHIYSDIGSDMVPQSHTDERFQQGETLEAHPNITTEKGLVFKHKLHENPEFDGSVYFQDEQIVDHDRLDAPSHFQLLNQSEVLHVSQSDQSRRHADRLPEQNLIVSTSNVQMTKSLIGSSETVTGKTPVLNSLLMKPPKYITWSQSSLGTEPGAT